MAIYSLHMGFVSRSEGRSAVGFSAYIAATRHVDERTGVVYNYECKNDVIVSRILAPDDAPEWAKNSSTLWNKADLFEDEIGSLRFRGHPDDPEKNQKSLEAKEQFLNSTQTAQTIMGAIPLEFSQEEAEVCVEEFLRERFVPRGLVVEYALHWQRGNPHFHGEITRRALEGNDFSQRKDHEIVSKAEHNITRKMWEVVVNKYLELGGHEARIDCRSNADRGSLFLPLAHEGWYAQHLAELGQYSRIVADNETVRQKNIEILCENPAAIIQEVALKRTTFTCKHIEDEIIRRVGGDEKLFVLLKARLEGDESPPDLILKQVNDHMVFEGISRNEAFATELKSLAVKLTDQLLENKEVSYEVGENINRDRIFTSAAYKKQEEKLVCLADSLHQKQTKVVSKEGIIRAIETCEKERGFSLSEEQRIAIAHLCSGPDIRLLNGRAGTGKTTLLKAVASAYQKAGYQVLGTSFQGKAVEIMEQEMGIPCKTLDSFDWDWKAHQQQKELVESGRLWGRPYLYAFNRMKALEKQRLNSNNVVIVDEANMIGGRLWELFLEESADKGVKVLIVQDTSQIKSREPGDYGRLFADRFGFCETREVVRQRIPWQRECSKLLNDHQILDGLKPYDEKGHFQWSDNAERLHQALTQDYVRSFRENPHKTHIALAYRNTEVDAINQIIREALKECGYLKECFQIHGEEYAIGDRVLFTRNDHYGRYVRNAHETSFPWIKEYLNPYLLRGEQNAHAFKGVKNGSFGAIESYDENRSLLTVLLDGNQKRRVQFNTKDYAYMTHGYAMGIIKSEASTFDKSFISLDPLMDPETTLVPMTRHRDDMQAYVNREQFVDFKDIIDKIGRISFKATLQDYQISEDQKPYFARVQQYRDLMVEAATLKEEMEGAPRWDSRASLDPTTPLYKHPSYTAYQTCFEEKKRVAETILKDWQDHAPYVRLAGIRRDVLEVEVGLRPRFLSDLEHRASIQVQGYMDLVRQTRVLWQTISETHPASLANSHALYEEYSSLKAERDSLAAVFQENPKLYTPFLKVTKIESPETTNPEQTVKAETYKDYWGEEVTKETRVYISAIKSHAEAHYKSQMQNLYYERLSPDQKTHYDFVKSYVDTRNGVAAIYSHLRKEEKEQTQSSLQIISPATFLTLEKLHELQAKRDEVALKIVESPEPYLPYFEVLKIEEDKLLDHALAGEFRELVLKYTAAATIEERLERADQLYNVVGEGDKLNKSFFGTLKSMNIEIFQLKFDRGCLELMKGKGGLPYQTISELSSAYASFHAYRKIHQETAKEWHIIKTHATQKVISLQDEQMKCLNRIGKNQNRNTLEWTTLEAKAAVALQIKNDGNIKREVTTKTLSFISHELARCVKGAVFSHQGNTPSGVISSNPSASKPSASSNPLFEDIYRQHKELMNFQSRLRSGHSGYVNLFKIDHPLDTTWENLREKKLFMASQALETSGEILKVAFPKDHRRMEKEVHEYHISGVVEEYQNARGEYKAALASTLIVLLEKEGDQRTGTRNQLKKSNENFEALYLYGLFHQLQFSLEKPEASLNALESYIDAQKTCSELWKARQEIVDKDLGELQERFNLHREELIGQLEELKPLGPRPAGRGSQGGNPTELGGPPLTEVISKQPRLNLKGHEPPKSWAYAVDQLLKEAEDVATNVQKLYGASLDKEKLEENLEAELLEGKVEDQLQEKIEAQNTSYGWDLTKEDVSSLTQEILALYRENKCIHEERLSLMNEKKFGNDDGFYESARDRNEAAFDLAESPFGKAIEKSREARSLNERADRHRAKLEKNKLQFGFNTAPYQMQGDLSSHGVFQLSHSFQKERLIDSKRGFMPKDQVLAAASGKYESLVTDLLLEPPNKRTRTELWFRKGKFVFNIAGTREDWWKDFKSGERGNIFHLVQREKNINFEDAIAYLANVLGVRADSPIIPERSHHLQKRSKEQLALEEAKETAQKLNAVSELQMKSKPIEGTIVETYLKKERGIIGPLPSDLKYIPKGITFMYKGARQTVHNPCLAAFGRNHEGRLSSVQLTNLDDQGKRALTKEGEKLNKFQYGVARASFVTIQDGKNTDRILTDRVFIAEGVETALSIKQAYVKGKIVASLGIGNISNYQGPEKEIIICVDNDDHKLNSKTHEILEKAQKYFTAKGQQVSMIKPAHPGDDFNDVLKKEGIKGVQEYVKEYHDPSMQALQEVPKGEEVRSLSTHQPKAIEPDLKVVKVNPDSIETLYTYMEEKIKKIKTFEGSSLADEAKRELDTYITILGKDEARMQEIRNFNPELAKEIETYTHNQSLGKSLGKGRGM